MNFCKWSSQMYFQEKYLLFCIESIKKQWEHKFRDYLLIFLSVDSISLHYKIFEKRLWTYSRIIYLTIYFFWSSSWNFNAEISGNFGHKLYYISIGQFSDLTKSLFRDEHILNVDKECSVKSNPMEITGDKFQMNW